MPASAHFWKAEQLILWKTIQTVIILYKIRQSNEVNMYSLDFA